MQTPASSESGAPSVIRKPGPWRVRPNLVDYAAERHAFGWDQARAALDGLPDSRGLNIAWEAVGRHAHGARAGHAALRFLRSDGRVETWSYGALDAASNRFANALERLGVRCGDAVFGFTGRVPEFYVAVLGALKLGAVFAPLFSAFGPEPLAARLALGRAKCVVTSEALWRRKLAPLLERLPALEHVIITDGEGGDARCRGYARLLAAESPDYTVPATDPEQPALLHFTSGTTGQPKGAIHAHAAVIAHHATGRYALDLHPHDVYWCTADPGWVTGMSYGVIAPLTHGITSIVDEAEFDAERWYRILDEQRVNVWYTAPTAIRMLMRAGTALARRRRYPALRFMASVGEPLDPEAVRWGVAAFDLPFHDNWWQTETGGIMIANFAAVDVRPGSMGLPLPGIDAAIVRRTPGGVEVLPPGVEGELALKAGWPSMFRGYLGDAVRYRACFAGDWYLTGDLARQDADGYYWFVGRADDVIKTAGHLVGPFEIESVLTAHPAVAEAAVIGRPDPVAYETVKAFVVLRPGHAPDEATSRDLLGHARRRLGAAVAPREIAFVPALPHTRSGKVLRRLLKARELGLPEGDLSTLEEGG